MANIFSQLFGDKEIQKALDVKDFIFTRETVSYGGRTIQLSAITRIWIYNLIPKSLMAYLFSKRNVLWGFLFSVFTAIVHDSEGDVIIAIFTFIIFGFIGLVNYIRQLSNKEQNGIVIETASGSENLVSKDKDFIEHLFVEISKMMNEENDKTIVANFQTGAINYADNSSISFGDLFNNITDSNINNRSNF